MRCTIPRRIEEDHKDFRDVYGNRIRKSLKKFINNGTIFRTRPNGKKVPITIPKMDIPHIVHGDNDKGVGRGDGKDGDVLNPGNGKGKGKGKGNKAGQEEGEGIVINLDLDEVLKFLETELGLPPLKPKPNETLEEEEIKYTSISLTGPESLRHNRRTMLQAIKRQAASGELDKLYYVPGFKDPIRLISPINSDKRYRQYKVIKKPSSNAVIFFSRDGSGSMDEVKCDIVSDMSWWIDIWIRRFYKRVERCYVWHDTQAMEVDADKFYRYRYGGGTMCSSALRFISKQFESRFPPEKWNFYVFYFTDGDNWYDDNSVFLKLLKEHFTPEIVNFVGITQILSYGAGLKEFIDQHKAELPNVKTTMIGNNDPGMSSGGWGGYGISDEERDRQIKQAIIDLMGTGKKSVASPMSASSDED